MKDIKPGPSRASEKPTIKQVPPRPFAPGSSSDGQLPVKRTGRKTKAELISQAQVRDSAALARMQPKTKPPARPCRRKAKGKEVASGSEVNDVTVASPSRGSRVRSAAPKSILDRLHRVKTQRMFLIDRRLHGTETEPMQLFKVLGSTGNVYTVVIGPLPRCDCPDCLKGNIPCKHIIFVFMKVLKVPETSTSWFQRALLPEEVREVFNHAPLSPHASVTVTAQVRAEYLRSMGINNDEVEAIIKEEKTVVASSARRMLSVGEDCPVCYEEMTKDDETKGKLVYDESTAGCGKALHKECFNMWAATAARKEEKATCVWCRAQWFENGSSGAAGGNKTAKSSRSGMGYVNMAGIAGMSRIRDTSTYYQGPMRGQHMWMLSSRYDDD